MSKRDDHSSGSGSYSAYPPRGTSVLSRSIVEYQGIIVQATPQTLQKEEDLGVQGSVQISLSEKIEVLLAMMVLTLVAVTVEGRDP